MNLQIEKFIKILALEIESMQDELSMLLHSLDDRLARQEISDYVRNENFVVLRNEVLGLRDCLHGLDDVRGCPAETLEDAADLARQTLHRRITDHGYVPALQNLLDARIDKIVRYITESEVPVKR